MTSHNEVKTAFAKAVSFAIEKMGVEKFKKTSFFGSNDPAREQLKEAA